MAEFWSSERFVPDIECFCSMAVLDGVSGSCVHVNGIFLINQRISVCLLLLSKEVQPGAFLAEEDFVVQTYWILQYLMHLCNLTRQNFKVCPSVLLE